jgi:tetratricopeptide (TPR) repeat protein
VSRETPATDPAVTRVTVTLTILAVLAILRGCLAFVPTMHAWGLNLLRFTAPVPGWTLWGIAALALVAALAGRKWPGTRDDARRDDGAAFGTTTYVVAAFAAAALVLALPDRTLFVGDTLLRQNTLEAHRESFAAIFPQALPLDRVLHDTGFRALRAALGAPPDLLARALGAIEAAMLAVLSLRLGAALGLGVAAARGAASVVFFTGALAVCTGYNKALSEMAVVTAAVGVFGVEATRRPRALLPMGIAAALGLLLHREALALMPAVVAAWILVLRRREDPVRWRDPGTIAAAAIPIAALVFLVPTVVRTIAGFDAVNFLSPEVQLEGGVARAAFSLAQLGDVANALMLVAPLAPLALLGFAVPMTGERRAERLILIVLALPLVVFMPFYHPAHGFFRNWDAFVPTAVAVSLLAAWATGVTLDRASARAGAWLAVAVAAAAPALQGLFHEADVERGLARVEAFVAGPPVPAALDRATAWDFLGTRRLDQGQVAEAAAAFARAAEVAPSPRILREWAVAEATRGDREAARAIYRRLLDRKPDDVNGWLEYAMLSRQQGDDDEALRAAGRALALAPGSNRARALIEEIHASGAGADSAR